MSGRGSRKRGRPPKTPNDRNVGKFNYQLLKKPKYLSKTLESQSSTPSASRASSPQESDGSRSNNRSKASGKGRGRGRKSFGIAHSNSFYPGRKGYESEYHYGSDFGDSSDKSDVDDDLLMSGSEDESLDGANESESDFSVCSFSQSGVGRPPRPPSPDPIWLQGREYPNLKLPESSQDLMIGNDLVIKALSIYEVLRRFRHLVRLSPFRFEDFCAALVCEEQSALLTDTHIMLLKAILREEDVQGTHFGPLDQKDSVNISLYLIDPITWPEVLRSYVECDTSFDRNIYRILSTSEYPYSGVDDRITVLQFLTDQFLTTNAVRDVMLQEGPIHYDDHCRICHRLGDLLCCETCPAVYHLECVDPPLVDVPTEDWQCNLCKAHKVSGVIDCVLPQEKQGVLIRHEMLGLDRHGRKFWFMTRRIFVEDQNSTNTWYYSSVAKFELLLALIDKDDLEAGLHAKLTDQRDEIMRQLKITERLTNEQKHNRKSCIDLENDTTKSRLNSIDGSSSGGIVESVVSSLKEGDGTDKSLAENKMVTRQKLNQLNTGTLYFKLGMENSFKSYVNHYTTNPIALNKPQRNEERDKRRHLSHKFSLTTASEFKWMGITMGTEENITMTIRQTLINFEQNISPPFMNPNWTALKKVWNAAVMNARRPTEFATVLLSFQASLKNVVFANVWHEQLGHIAFQRITSAEREDRKKLEKREKRERDDEEERNRLAFNYIKYSLGLKHQVWKQKGEEYRVHGQWGWMWLSSSRRCSRHRRSVPRGQILIPASVNVHYTDGDDTNEIIIVDPRTQRFMRQCERDAQLQRNYQYQQRNRSVKIQQVVDTNRDIGVINVSKSLVMAGRLLYPKMGRRSCLDELLTRRMELKEAEERPPGAQEATGANVGGSGKGQPQKPAPKSVAKTPRQMFLEKRLLRLVESQPIAAQATNFNLSLVNSLATKIQTVRLQFSQLNRFAKQFRCYTKECNTNSNAVSQITQNTCYSPLCLQKARAKKELLLLLRRAHTAGHGSRETMAAILGAVKKPSILEQKLTEGKKESLQSLDDTDDSRHFEESPLDLLQDWENARATAVPYDEKLLVECYEPLIKDAPAAIPTIKNERDTGDDDRAGAGLGLADESKMDFIDNMDVCSTVEVESSETTAEDSLAALVGGDDSFALLSGRRSRKSNSKARNKSSYVATKDTHNQTQDKEIAGPPGRQNRRFPTYSTKPKREDSIKSEREYYSDGRERIYAAATPRGRVYLWRDTAKLLELKQEKGDKTAAPGGESGGGAIASQNCSKFPMISHFLTHKLKKSLLVLPQHELQKLARVGGKISTNGFHHLAKNNNAIWPYQCARPLFKTCWSFRTSNAATLCAVALQLRVLWACLRWDDMIAKPPSADGKHQMSTESEIVTVELLKLRHIGRYGERTQYLRRKRVTPLEMPKTIREVTSIRSGLRKRKRAESPQPTEPQITEEWVEEDKLELWEIKFIGEKHDKARLSATTRSSTLRQSESSGSGNSSGSLPSSQTPQNGNLNKSSNVKTNEDIKEKMEHQLKLQRAAHQQKKAAEALKANPNVKGQLIGNRRVVVKNPDGTTRIIQQAITTQTPKYMTVTSEAQSSSSTGVAVPKATTQQGGTSGTSSSGNSQPHKVQIIRGQDGKVSVRGLNANQQLIQMPDGKLHVLTTSAPVAGGATGSSSPGPTKIKLPMNAAAQSSSGMLKPVAMKNVTAQGTSGKIVQFSNTSKLISKVQPKAGGQAQAVQSVQKIVTNAGVGGQIVTSSTNAVSSKLLNSAQNLQQLNLQPGQKLLVGQNVQGQKVIISSSGQQAATAITGQQVLSAGSSLSTATLQQQPQQQQQIILNQVASPALTGTTSAAGSGQATQKVIQQIVNTSNVQQQIMFGGQRIILSPGQTIVTQRSVTQPQQQLQVVQQQPQQQQMPTTTVVAQQQHPQQQHQLQTPNKLVKHVIVQQQQQQPLQQVQPDNTHTSQPMLKVPQVGISSANTTTSTSSSTAATASSSSSQQIVVQNSTLAQQLAQGKLQVATINGQQVIIKPLGNNQAQIVAHIKTQSDGNAHIVTSTSAASDMPTTPAQSPVKLPVTPTTPTTTPQKQPQPQLLQPRTPQLVLQQQTTELPQHQPIQQQIQTNFLAQTQAQPQQQDAQHIVQTQQQQQQQMTTKQPMTIEENLLQGQPPGTVIKCVTAQVIQTEAGPRIVLQGLVGNDFTQQQLALVQQQVKQQLLKAQQASGKQGVLGPTKIYLAVQPPNTAGMNSQPPPLTPVLQSSSHQQVSHITKTTTIDKRVNAELTTTTATTNFTTQPNSKQNVTIKTTSSSSSPITTTSSVAAPVTTTAEAASDDISIAENQQDMIHSSSGAGDSGAGDGSGRSIVQSGRLSQTKNHNIKNNTLKQVHINPETEKKILQLQKQLDQPRGSPSMPRSQQMSGQSKMPSSQGSVGGYGHRKVSRRYPSLPDGANKMRRIDTLKPIGGMLMKNTNAGAHANNEILQVHKDNLKQNILKKRSLLERNLQIEINEEMTTKPPSIGDASDKNDARAAKPLKDSLPSLNKRKPRSVKRGKSQESESINDGRDQLPNANANPRSQLGKPKKMNKNRKGKLYCICQTPYDDSKFYVGCDLCSNWFHGDCIGITEEDSEDVAEYICDDCKTAREKQELYCSCRQPYDDSQFYICCDQCQDWFHGRCVGIVQSEAEFIDEYVCPDCQRKASVNNTNMRKLTDEEIIDLKTLIQQIKAHKSAWPFLEAVDIREAPDYYKVIKEPMDLKKMETKLETNGYTTLSEFIGDMTKIFDNCRYYNRAESSFYKCAETLEQYFVQKIKNFREHISGN